MPATPDDTRIAATLKTTLACAVIASAFAAIAVQAALAVFVIDKRQNLASFITVAVIAALMLVMSAILGSVGVSKVYKPGYSGTWNVEAGKGYFSGQAITGFLGLLLVVVSAFVGDPKPDAPKEPPDYQALKNSVAQLQKDVVALQALKQQPVSPASSQPKKLKPRRND
jgi:hypothetical protein